MRLRSLLMATVAVCLLSSGAAMAQLDSTIISPADAGIPDNPFSQRGGTLPPVLGWLQGQDVKLTYLGDDGGLKGYLGEASNGRHQVFYPTPDGEHMVAGIVFRAGGSNVTSVQIAQMLSRFADVAKTVEGADLSSVAEVPAEATVSDGVDEPIMDWFREHGNKVTSVDGREGGLDGFVVETPVAEEGAKSKMQFFYVMPDDRYAVAGILTKRGGVNVTGLQVAAFQQKYQVAAAVAGNNGSAVIPGANPPSVPADILVPDVSSPTLVAQSPEAIPAPAEIPAPTTVAPAEVPAAVPVAPAPTAPVPGPGSAPVGPSPVLDTSPVSSAPATAADRFYDATLDAKDLLDTINERTIFFTVGKADRPALYMVADPQCPFCHQAWESLRPMVFSGKIQLRVIMIAGLAGSDPLARSILSQPDPSSVWIAGQGSMRNVRIDPPPAVGSADWTKVGRYLEVNHAFIDKFKINRTPFLAYVDKTGRVIASRGVPDDFSQFLAAIE